MVLHLRGDLRSERADSRPSTSPSLRSAVGRRMSRSDPRPAPRAHSTARREPGPPLFFDWRVSIDAARDDPVGVATATGAAAVADPRRRPRCRAARAPASPVRQRSDSCRPGRSRAVCAWGASRRNGVRHGSPLSALHFGHGRARHPRATCSFVGDVVLLRYDVRQRKPGATRQVGYYSSKDSARSLTMCPVAEALPGGAVAHLSGASRGLGRPAAGSERRDRVSPWSFGRRTATATCRSTVQLQIRDDRERPSTRPWGCRILTLGLTRTLRAKRSRLP